MPARVLAQKIRDNIASIEDHRAITDDEKVSRLTHIACSVCAAVGAQPAYVPGIFPLGRLQMYFASRIAAIRGVPLTEAEYEDYMRTMFGVAGLSILVELLLVGAWKVLTFGFGGTFTVVPNYAMTFAVMKVANSYFSAKASGEALSRQQLRAIFRAALREGRTKGATERRKIKARDQR